MLERVDPLRCSMQRKSSRSGMWPPLLQQLSKESEGCQYLINWDCSNVHSTTAYTHYFRMRSKRGTIVNIYQLSCCTHCLLSRHRRTRDMMLQEKRTQRRPCFPTDTCTRFIPWQTAQQQWNASSKLTCVLMTITDRTVRNHSKYKIRETQLIIADMVSSQESNQAMRISTRTTAWTQLCSFRLLWMIWSMESKTYSFEGTGEHVGDGSYDAHISFI